VKVLVTGASGYISRQLIGPLAEHHDLVLLDVVAPGPEAGLPDVHVVDLTSPEIDAYLGHFEGVDAVIHNAFHVTPGHISSSPRQWLDDRPAGDPDGYYAERRNLDMAFHVYKAALKAGVKRVIHTSSNHAADWYEGLIHRGALDMVTPETPPKSDNFYGWAKDTIEHMGFMFATGRFGRPVESVNIRIGGPRPFVAEKYADNPVSFRRELGAFVSERDLAQLYVKSLEADSIENEHGVPFQIFYGISNNARAFWGIANARKVVGYAPQDDSEVLYRDDIARHLGSNGRTFG